MKNNDFKKGLVFVVIALFTLSSIVPSIVGEGEEYFYANQDIPVQNGGINGDYTDTHSTNNVYEAISERESGGKPSRRYSYLEHKWTFDIIGTFSSLDFYVEAYHTPNSEGDDFVFAYSTNDADYSNLLTVTKTSDDDTMQIASLPDTLSGTIYIRVKDTDQTQSRKVLDTIYIDHMYIEGISTPDTTPPVISDVSSTLYTGGNEIITYAEGPCWKVWEFHSGTWVNTWTSPLNTSARELGDVDGDGENEIVGGVVGPHLAVWEYDNNGGWNISWVSSEYVGGWEWEIGDADNDGINEIFTSGFPNHNYTEYKVVLYKWNSTINTYEQIWSEINSDYWLSFSCGIGDVNHDNSADLLIMGGSYVMYLWEYQDGTWVQTTTIPQNGAADQIFVGDADNDGLNEIVYSGNLNKVFVVKYVNGEFVEIWNSGDMGAFVQDCAVGDVDNDGKNEIIAGTTSIINKMYVWEYQGENSWDLVWSQVYDNTGMHVMNICDVDNDGLNEFTTGSADQWHIFEHLSGNDYQFIYSSEDMQTDSMNIATGDADNDVDDPIMKITWNTDEPSNSVVNYGTTTTLGNTSSDSTFVTSHQIILTGLLPDENYYYEVQSTDSSGNIAIDDNGGDYYVFTTQIDSTAPTILNIETTEVTYNSVTISWDTDEQSHSQVNYDVSIPPGESYTKSEMVTIHSITITDLQPDTQYYFEVQSTDRYSNTAIDNDGGLYYSFTTSQAPNNLMHVSSIDMWPERIKNRYNIYTKVKIVDASNNPVEGAIVNLETMLPNGDTITVNDITDSTGFATFVYGPTPKRGTYTSSVTDVAKDGWTYNSDDNVETSESLIIP